MSSDATEMPGSEPGKATHAEFASVQPASAAMPSEETERAFNLAARAMQRRFKASGSEEEIEAALSALFAPILAEKERDITTLAQRLAHAYEAKHRCNEDANYERARALAAEAALAAERERCAKVVEGWAEEHAAHLADDAPSPIGRHRAAMNDGYALAAAIRAQGE